MICLFRTSVVFIDGVRIYEFNAAAHLVHVEVELVLLLVGVQAFHGVLQLLRAEVEVREGGQHGAVCKTPATHCGVVIVYEVTMPASPVQ